MELSYKQFLISNHRLDAWRMEEIALSGGAYLYVGNDVLVRRGVTCGGLSYVLIGEAFCTNSFPREVVEDLDKDVSGDLFAISRYWTGRWVLILGKELITDACGLMSAYYVKHDTGWMLSSSLSLISRQLGWKITNKVATTGLNWQLLPATILDSVKTLFCTQKMTLNDELDTTFCNRFAEWKGLMYEERVTTITTSLKTSLKNIEKYSNRKIWIALTAGKDSRLTFAAALASGVQFDTYTASHRNLSDADRSIPVKLTKQYGVTHHVLKSEPFSKQRFEEYCAFTGNNSLGADAEFYASGQFDQIPTDVISIKSGLFEAGQVYARKIAGNEEKSFISGIWNYYKTSLKNKKQKDAFNEWINYQRENPIPGIDIRDRFYLEQRANGWAAAIEQSLDINSFASIQIANSAVIVGSLLYATPSERENLRLSYDLIRSLDKSLLDYPVNKSSLRDTIRNIVNGIKRRFYL